MDRIRGLAGAVEAASRGAGALPGPAATKLIATDPPTSIVVAPHPPIRGAELPARSTPSVPDVDLSLYELVASPGTKNAGKAVMIVLAALAALLVVGFGVVLFAAGAPDTIRNFFN